MEFVVVDRLLLCLRSGTDLPPMNCTAMKQESISPNNSFRSAAALAIFCPTVPTLEQVPRSYKRRRVGLRQSRARLAI